MSCLYIRLAASISVTVLLSVSAQADSSVVYHWVHKLPHCFLEDEPPYASPDTAANKIQTAIDFAATAIDDGSTAIHVVLVLPGFPAAETPFCFEDTNDYEENITLKDGVHVIGLFGATIVPEEEGPVVSYTHDTAEDATGFATLAGFNIRDGLASAGGGVYVKNAQLNLFGNRIKGCTATSGGGVYIEGSLSCLLSDNLIEGCTAGAGGGVYLAADSATSPQVLVKNHIKGNIAGLAGGGGIYLKDQSTAVIEKNRIVGNTSSAVGGGILVDGGATGVQIGLNEIEGNSATDGGGIAVIDGSDAVIVQNEIALNFASSAGGGIYVRGTGSAPRIGIELPTTGINTFGNVIDRNFAALAGGGIGVASLATPSVSGNQIARNRAGGTPFPSPALPAFSGSTGGGIWWSSSSAATTGAITGNDLSENLAAEGAGAYIDTATIDFIGGRFEKNAAGATGGGIYLKGCASILDEVRLVNNFSLGSGGGVAAADGASALAKECVVRQNVAALSGGGLYAFGTDTEIELGVAGEGNIFEANAAIDGGGGFVGAGATLTAIDNLLVHNLGSFSPIISVFVGGGSGGALMASGASLIVGDGETGNLLHGNFADHGGAVAGVAGASVLARANLFELNSADVDGDGFGRGGAIFASDDGTILTVGGDAEGDPNEFDGNTAGSPWTGDPASPARMGYGGAVAVDELAATAIIKNRFTGNAVSRNGGCIWFHHLDDAVVRGSLVDENGCGFQPGPELPCLPVNFFAFGFTQWQRGGMLCPVPEVCDLSSLSDPDSVTVTPTDDSGDSFFYMKEGDAFESEVTFEWPEDLAFPPDGELPDAESTSPKPDFACMPYGPGSIPGGAEPVKPVVMPSDPEINLVTLNGGFLAVEDSSGVATSNTIQRNFAERSGGGVWIGDTEADESVLVGMSGSPNVIQNNLSAFGGGVGVVDALSATVHHNLIGDLTDANAGNQAFDGGGGVWIEASSPDVRFNVIANNAAGMSGQDYSSPGGGVAALDAGGAVACNWIVRNYANGDGGGAWIEGDASDILIDHNTFAENDAIERGSGVFVNGYTEFSNNLVDHFGCYDSYAVYVNRCADIVRNNVYPHTGRRYGGLFLDLTGESFNLSAEPIFVNPAGGDFNLAVGSPSAPNPPGDGCNDTQAQGWTPVPGLPGFGQTVLLRVPEDYETISEALAYTLTDGLGLPARVVVAPGKYDEKSGESFPLPVRDGVVLVSTAVEPPVNLGDISKTIIDAGKDALAMEIFPFAGKRTAIGGFTIYSDGAGILADNFSGYLFGSVIVSDDDLPGAALSETTAWLEHLTVVAPDDVPGVIATVDAPAASDCQGSPRGPYFSHNLSSVIVNLPPTTSLPEGEEPDRDVFAFVNDFYAEPACGGELPLPCDIRGNKLLEDPLFDKKQDLFLGDLESPAWRPATLDRRLIGALPLVPQLSEDVLAVMSTEKSGTLISILESRTKGAKKLSPEVAFVMRKKGLVHPKDFGALVADQTPQRLGALDVNGDGLEEFAVLAVNESGEQALHLFTPPRVSKHVAISVAVFLAGGKPKKSVRIGQINGLGEVGSDAEALATVNLDLDGDGVEELGVLRVNGDGLQSFHIHNLPEEVLLLSADPDALDPPPDLGDERAGYTELGTVGGIDEVQFIAAVELEGDGRRGLAVVRLNNLTGGQTLALYRMPACPEETLPAALAFDATYGTVGEEGEAGEVRGFSGADPRGVMLDVGAVLRKDKKDKTWLWIGQLPGGYGDPIGEPISQVANWKADSILLGVIGLRIPLDL